MKNVVIVAVVILLLVVLVVVIAKKLGLLRKPSAAGKLPFKKRDYVLSKAERSFFEALMTTIDSQWMVLAKIRLLDLVWLPRGTENAQSYRNRVQSKHVDFVLCDRKSISPLLVIELDDASHETQTRQRRDQLVDAVLDAAGLPVLRVRAKQGYVTNDLRQQLIQAMGSELRPQKTPAAAASAL